MGIDDRRGRILDSPLNGFDDLQQRHGIKFVVRKTVERNRVDPKIVTRFACPLPPTPYLLSGLLVDFVVACSDTVSEDMDRDIVSVRGVTCKRSTDAQHLVIRVSNYCEGIHILDLLL
jgi:hypothetical protein